MPEHIKRVFHVESRNESVIRSCLPVRFARNLLDVTITVMQSSASSDGFVELR
jgi:hypothetical protein